MRNVRTTTYTGLNIQFPISRLILRGDKIVETRTYPLPRKYVGRDLLMVETPGKTGNFQSRIVAIIRFDESFKYKSQAEFYADYKRHRVDRDSEWSYDQKKGKWGWPISHIQVLTNAKPLKRRPGIIYSLGLALG